jgi:hypothetical protein
MHILVFIGIICIGSAASYLLKYHGTIDVDAHFFVGMMSGIIASGISDFVRDCRKGE